MSQPARTAALIAKLRVEHSHGLSDDAANEIERLQRLLDARPPYYCFNCDCANCGNTRAVVEPTAQLDAFIGAYLDAFIDAYEYACRRDASHGDSYSMQEVRDTRRELVAAMRAVQPPRVDEYEAIGWQYKFPSSWGDGTHVWCDHANRYNGSDYIEAREIFAKKSTTVTKSEGL